MARCVADTIAWTMNSAVAGVRGRLARAAARCGAATCIRARSSASAPCAMPQRPPTARTDPRRRCRLRAVCAATPRAATATTRCGRRRISRCSRISGSARRRTSRPASGCSTQLTTGYPSSSLLRRRARGRRCRHSMATVREPARRRRSPEDNRARSGRDDRCRTAATACGRPGAPHRRHESTAANRRDSAISRGRALPDGVRVTIEMDARDPSTTNSSTIPRRLFFDLKDARPRRRSRTPTLNFTDDVVREIRLGRHPQNTTRIVMDMEGVESYSVFTLYNPFRVVVDFTRTGAGDDRVSGSCCRRRRSAQRVGCRRRPMPRPRAEAVVTERQGHSDESKDAPDAVRPGGEHAKPVATDDHAAADAVAKLPCRRRSRPPFLRKLERQVLAVASARSRRLARRHRRRPRRPRSRRARATASTSRSWCSTSRCGCRSCSRSSPASRWS